MYDDIDAIDQFIEDFVSELKEKKICVYEYDANVSFRLVKKKLTKYFREKFKYWKKSLKEGEA